MLKKNMRKRLLAGALATIMALTMCPTWALADDEGVTTLPDIENSVPVVDSAPAVDPTETPDVPSSSDTEAPAEDQNPAPAPSDDGANGGTDVAESGNNSSSNENDSQNNDAEIGKWIEKLLFEASSRGIKGIWWDNNYEDTPGDSFAIFRRATCEWIRPDVTACLLKCRV